MACLVSLTMGLLSGCSKESTDNADGGSGSEYVDLGLPSGTKWKIRNEQNPNDSEYGFFTYDEAWAIYHDQLPSDLQFKELKNNCQWEWIGNGYKVIGANNNYILLPAVGYRTCDMEIGGENLDGSYWSSTSVDASNAISLDISQEGAVMNTYYRCMGYSIRLVKRK